MFVFADYGACTPVFFCVLFRKIWAAHDRDGDPVRIILLNYLFYFFILFLLLGYIADIAGSHAMYHFSGFAQDIYPLYGWPLSAPTTYHHHTTTTIIYAQRQSPHGSMINSQSYKWRDIWLMVSSIVCMCHFCVPWKTGHTINLPRKLSRNSRWLEDGRDSNYWPIFNVMMFLVVVQNRQIWLTTPCGGNLGLSAYIHEVLRTYSTIIV